MLESRYTWCDSLLLSPEAKSDLWFWSSSISKYNGQPIWHSPSAVRVVYSDASSSGYGGYVVQHGACISHGKWTADENKEGKTKQLGIMEHNSKIRVT